MKTYPLHPEHRDPSHSDGRIDIGLEEVENFDYRNLKSDLIKKLPFISMKYENEVYKSIVVSKSIIGNYYLSKGISYEDLPSRSVSTGNQLKERKEELQEWLLNTRGSSHDYVPFDAFYQISKEINNSLGLLLSRGVNVRVDFFNQEGSFTTEYDIKDLSSPVFTVYFKITNQFNRSIYSEQENILIKDKFAFSLSFEGNDVTEAIDSISFSDEVFSMNLKTSYFKQSGKLSLSVEYIYYGLVREVSCYLNLSKYTIRFFDHNNSIINLLNEKSEEQNEFKFIGYSVEDFIERVDFGNYVTYYLKAAVFEQNNETSLQLDTCVLYFNQENPADTNHGKINNSMFSTEDYDINSSVYFTSTYGGSDDSFYNNHVEVHMILTSGDKTFKIDIKQNEQTTDNP